jgi:hypothetical protein
MNPNLLWLVWVVGFFILETLGLFGVGGMKPLTFWVRGLIADARTGWAVASFFGWLVYHFFVEPFWRARRGG